MITTLSRIANCCVPARNTAETVGVQMTECDKTWWMLSDIVDWVRRIDPTATVGRIRVALADACAANSDTRAWPPTGFTSTTDGCQSHTGTRLSSSSRTSM